MRVDELMKTEVHTCHADTNLETVAMLMWNNDCGSIPVIDAAGMPIAMITDRDITMGSALNHKPLWDIATRQVANSNSVLTCKVDDSVQTALSIMQQGQIRRLPVVDDEGLLQGILSMDDLIQAAKPKKTKNVAVSYAEVMSTLKDVSVPVKH